MVRTAENLAGSGGDPVVIALAGEAALGLFARDPQTDRLRLMDKLTLPGAEGACRGVPLVAGVDGERLYLAWRGAAFRLYSIAVDPVAGRLTCLGSVGLPASMCYLALSPCGTHVLSSSNVGSVIAASPIDADGCALDPVLTREAFKAHCVEPAPNGLIYATSLRGDHVQAYRFVPGRSELHPLSRLELPAGSGPRHLRFTADGRRGYLLSEFAGTLTCLDVDARSGALSPRQSLALLTGGDKVWAAELRLGADGTRLYASERSTSRIFTCGLGASGEMTLLGAVAAPDCPTAFALTRCGGRLIALGEKSGEAWTYRIGPEGLPALANREQVGAVPSWVLSL